MPVGQFWALTLYSENTRRPYDNGGTELRSANLGSTLTDLKRNADGSVDLYIGAKAPAGFERNFMKTVGDDGWFVYFRLYAPEQAYFDKTFALGDFERLDRLEGPSGVGRKLATKITVVRQIDRVDHEFIVH